MADDLPIDPRAFRNVLGQFCTGITIITTVTSVTFVMVVTMPLYC